LPLTSSDKDRDRRNAFCCALAVAIAVLACFPLLEMGINDDWSYALTARDLARTGHFVYNGWATAMIGAQAAWAALFIKLFGFSYTLVRLTTLPLAMSCAALIYALHRRAGIDSGRALFGTLAICLCPVFIPMAASFMTDIPGLFFLLLCCYSVIRAMESVRQQEGERRIVGWLLLTAVTGVLGGTVRQIVWATLPVCFIGFSFFFWRFHNRKDTNKPVAAVIGLLCMTLFAVAACISWFQSQPRVLSESEAFLQGFFEMLDGLPGSLGQPLSGIVLSCAALLLPVLLSVLPVSCEVVRRRLSPILIVILGLLGGTIAIAGRQFFFRGVWLGNIVTPSGMLGSEMTTTGSRPLIMPLWGFTVFSIVVCLCLMTTVLAVIVSSKPKLRAPSDVHAILWGVAFVYIPLLFPRFFVGGAVDRYMIPLLVVSSVTLLRWHQDVVISAEKSPDRALAMALVIALPAGWIFVALYGTIGVAITHDYIACLRAERAAASYLTQKLSIPRTKISAGFEFDCTTQAMQQGYLNDPRIHPKSLYHKPDLRKGRFPYFRWWFSLTPSLTPRYFVVLSPQQELKTTNLPSIGYNGWLPRGRRQVLIQLLPEK
jgi:hypothetical protein